MRIPNSAHESRPWRIREIVPDFELEDVWALPAYGGAGDFRGLVDGGWSRRTGQRGSIPSGSSGGCGTASAAGSGSGGSRTRGAGGR